MNQDQINYIRAKCIEANAQLNGNELECEYCHIVKDRRIRLADVLLAIEEKTKFESTGHGWEAMKDMVAPRFINGKLIHSAFWNLRADDLQEQSDETIKFLYELLK